MPAGDPGPGRWRAPLAPAPVRAVVAVPGSKSETNRALVLAALSAGTSTLAAPLDARDTRLMRAALRVLGAGVDDRSDPWRIRPGPGVAAGGTVDCGLAGTVMRFVPPVAALADGPVHFDGDEQAYARPMGVLLAALAALGARVEGSATRLPFTLTGRSDLPGGEVTIDASGSSQFVSGLLLAGARYRGGVDLRHAGRPVPSRPHIDMTVSMLRDRGVEVDDLQPDRWVVRPGPIAPLDARVEPDLTNAAVFLAAAAVTGGTVTVPHWPRTSHQPGNQVRHLLAEFGAEVDHVGTDLTVRGTGHLRGVDVDLSGASELTPVVAALAALADSTTHIRGVAHIRGHETDRLAALETELERLGASVRQTDDGLVIHPRLLGGDTWRTYADHRMAHAGALLGLVVPDVELDDVTCTTKAMPGFVDLWTQMLGERETPDR